jgi:hypothetical protein
MSLSCWNSWNPDAWFRESCARVYTPSADRQHEFPISSLLRRVYIPRAETLVHFCYSRTLGCQNPGENESSSYWWMTVFCSRRCCSAHSCFIPIKRVLIHITVKKKDCLDPVHTLFLREIELLLTMDIVDEQLVG